ncbi:hypothetical protein [Thiosulfativibrio zosterae]|uniref:Uncharacterized protein n=1 Tax=Thiosulfativibrio zosterae TaxID=2675053 RepID=A0A6F8PQI0_9GAMM|nr:hypothetical protein [Thiosulfativibrio zosterae]BBP44294.1 hypothetical protein THMIRHAT_20400 [Thiosulfativibrio zosterae]
MLALTAVAPTAPEASTVAVTPAAAARTLIVSIPVITAALRAVASVAVTTKFNVSVPAPPLIMSAAFKVSSVPPLEAIAVNVSLADEPVNAVPWSTPVVSDQIIDTVSI